MTRPRAVRIALWMSAMVLAVIIVARAHYTADLSAFLPRAPNARQRMLVDQLREGPASRLLLIAIVGADATARAQLSTAIARQLRADTAFSSVSNGEAVNQARDREFLFDHRYLLSDAVTPQRFSVSGLYAAVDDTIALLASPAGLLAKSLLPRDPTGEFLQVLNQLDRTAQPRLLEGVWASPDGQRALLLASTRTSGSDIDAEERAVQAIRAAFAKAQQSSGAPAVHAAQLLVTGPPVFAVAARATIKHEAVRLSIVSTLLIVSLLLAVYRSLPVLLLGLLPVTSAALAGIAAVALGFGVVHGITLAFGITLIGESVDYSIYLFVQSRRPPDGAMDFQRRERLLWRTILLGVLTSVCGFASLLPSGFPGLSQLGLYSIAGLIAAAAVTRFILPTLMPVSFQVRDLTPLGNMAAQILFRVRTWRWLLGVVALFAGVILYLQRDALWNRDLAALSPLSARAQALDATLRADLGAPDVSEFVVVTGSDLQTVLRATEKVAGALDVLISNRTIGDFDSPARYLPSLATQAARRASLPDTEQLRARLHAATATLGLRAERLEPFVQDVARARAAPLLTPPDLKGTSFEGGFDALTMRQHEKWSALLPLHAAQAGAPTSDGAMNQVRAAVERAAPGQALLLSLKSESDALYSSYLSEALRLSGAGLAAIVVLLLVTLRSPSRVAGVVAPLVLAVLVVAAALLLGGRSLTILHLIGMLLIVAVGSNYALFFDRSAADQHAGPAPLTLASLLIANATTVVGFGVLAFSQVPVLAALGSTVAPGAFLALVFSAALSRTPPPPRLTRGL
jgi:predicted exporter